MKYKKLFWNTILIIGAVACITGVYFGDYIRGNEPLEDCSNGQPYVVSEPENFEVRNGTVLYEGELKEARQEGPNIMGFLFMMVLLIIIILICICLLFEEDKKED